jgi:predicted CxxxxCH...CXXCH cytochrome family protein
MPRPGIHARRRGGPRALIVVSAALALSCAEERAREDACPDCDGIHPVGISDPDSADFHGRELERRDWDFAVCASCHGADLDGGAAGVSCLSCHQEGVTACSTCHDDRPQTAAHPAHIAAYECAECHEVPERWDAEGHILRAGRADTAPAEVVFGEAARRRPPFAAGGDEPSYDPDTGACSGVYCHGDPLGDPAATTPRPVWTAGAGQAECGACHGDPPDSHAAGTACATCHPGDAPHIDGALAIGTVEGCSGCHGSEDGPAPPRDLAGNTRRDAIGVGAHRGHLRATLRLRGPLPCDSCHQVPDEITSAGHIDSAAPAEVALVGGGSWDRGDATCTTWCHGDSQPVWTAGAGQVACGTCHGIPPAGGLHTPDMELSDCADCHPATVDAFGNILRSGPPGAETSEHMDGTVDF